MINCKGCERSGRGLILRYYPRIFLERPSNSTKNLSQDSRSSTRDLKLGPPEYEAGVFRKVDLGVVVTIDIFIIILSAMLNRNNV
jgi:hypothetical protein